MKFLSLVVSILGFHSCYTPDFTLEQVRIAHGVNSTEGIDRISFKRTIISYNSNHDTLAFSEKTLTLKTAVQCDNEDFLFSNFLLTFPAPLSHHIFSESYQGMDTIAGNKEVHIIDLHYTCGDEEVAHRIYCSAIHNRILYHLIKWQNEFYWIDPITRGKQEGRLWDLRRKIYHSDKNGNLDYLYADQVISEIKRKN